MRPFMFKYNSKSYIESEIIDTGAEILQLKKNIN